MRTLIISGIAVVFVFGLSMKEAMAQFDPSVIGASESSGWTGDSTNTRYVHKKKTKKIKRAVASEDAAVAPGTIVPSPTPSDVASLADGNAPGPRLAPNSSPVPIPVPAPTDGHEPLTNKVRDVVLGGDDDLIQNYRAFLDDQDIRKNLFELSLDTGYLYNTSTSSYYFKNYLDSGPTVEASANIWLTPFLGMTAGYQTTLLNEISDSPTQNNFVSTTQSWMNFGVKFRRFFGMALNSAAVELGLQYFDYQLRTPQSSQSRSRIDNQGPELDIGISLPSGRSAFWNIGFLIQPFDNYTESSGASVRAGSSNQTVGFGMSVGAEYRMGRQLCTFLKLSGTLYKTDFTGSASSADPLNSSTPSSVPVTNAFYMLSLGVRFGH